MNKVKYKFYTYSTSDLEPVEREIPINKDLVELISEALTEKFNMKGCCYSITSLLINQDLNGGSFSVIETINGVSTLTHQISITPNPLNQNKDE